jgi:phosphotriesterase-related protein
MSSVETVKGRVDVDRLGRTLMHEHVFIVNPELLENYYADWWDEDERVRDAAAKLTALKQRGIDTIVDPTVLGLGRSIPRIQRVAELVDVTIIVATGLYTYDEVPHQFEYRGPGRLIDVPEPLVDMYIGDIRDGIGRTGVKAAFLKGAIAAKGMTHGVERNLRAIAAAHRETGAPITVHTDAHAQMGRPLLDLFRQEGVHLDKVVLGHSGDSNDLDYLKELADTGAILGMDRFGLDVFNPTAQRIATIAALCAQGYTDRMVLSHDASCLIDYFPGDLQQLAAELMPNWNYLHISDDVLPALREHGVDDAQIEQMLVDNPRRYFDSGGA